MWIGHTVFLRLLDDDISRRNDPKKLHRSYKQGCRQHAYFPPSAADHGLQGVSLLPPANYVHMRSVIPDVHEVVDCKTQQVEQQKSIHPVSIT